MRKLPPSQRINQYGFITGGMCHQRLKDRKCREIGMLTCLQWMCDQGFITSSKGWYQFRKQRWYKRNKMGWREKESLAGPGSGRKIGWYRFEQDLIPALIQYNKKFRWSLIKKWCYEMAAMESDGLVLQQGKGHDQYLYEAIKKNPINNNTFEEIYDMN